MRLELVVPPRRVSVDGAPALLMATRGDRHYVQVSHGVGLNCLRWVPAAALRPPGAAAPATSGTTDGGLPPAFGARGVRRAAAVDQP